MFFDIPNHLIFFFHPMGSHKIGSVSIRRKTLYHDFRAFPQDLCYTPGIFSERKRYKPSLPVHLFERGVSKYVKRMKFEGMHLSSEKPSNGTHQLIPRFFWNSRDKMSTEPQGGQSGSFFQSFFHGFQRVSPTKKDKSLLLGRLHSEFQPYRKFPIQKFLEEQEKIFRHQIRSGSQGNSYDGKMPGCFFQGMFDSFLKVG